jgi:hypothetical protein
MGFLGDIANSGIGSDLLSLYNAQKEVESRDTLRQIQQQQLEEKKRAELEREADRHQARQAQHLNTASTIFKTLREAGDYEGAGQIFENVLKPMIPGAEKVQYKGEKDKETITIEDVGGQRVLMHRKGDKIQRWEPVKSTKDEKYSLENIAAGKVQAGEMTLEDAYKLKQRERESPQEAAGKESARTSARYTTKIQEAEKQLGRKLTQAEKRQMFVNDPYGMLGSAEGEGTAPTGQPKPLDAKTAKSLLDEAKGDKDKARELAKKRGYTF